MSFFEALADALQAPLRNIVCATSGPFTVGVSAGLNSASLNLGYVIPADCNRPVAPEISPVSGRGQCPQVLYNVSWNVRRPDGVIVQWGPFTNVVGPVTGIGEEWTRDFFGNLNHTTVLICPNDQEQGGVRRFGPYSAYSDPTRAARSFIRTIARVDGLPDDCPPGTPPPPPPPQTPTPPVALPPITFQFGPNTFTIGGDVIINPSVNIPVYGGIHIPVTVNINPGVAFPGGISLPVYLSLPNLSINVPISFVNVDLSAEIKPTLQIQVWPPVPGGGGGELGYTERIIGVNVTSTIQQGAAPSLITSSVSQRDLYVPRLGVVRFTPPAWASNALGVDVDIKTTPQFVNCPWWFGAVGFDILPNVGVSCVSSPVTARVADLVVPV